MSGQLFTFTLADGREVTGRVQGNGGEIGAGSFHSLNEDSGDDVRAVCLARVEHAICRANDEDPLPIYEPIAGHVRLYIGSCKPSHDEEEILDIDVRGATVRIADVSDVEVTL